MKKKEKPENENAGRKMWSKNVKESRYFSRKIAYFYLSAEKTGLFN